MIITKLNQINLEVVHERSHGVFCRASLLLLVREAVRIGFLGIGLGLPEGLEGGQWFHLEFG